MSEKGQQIPNILHTRHILLIGREVLDDHGHTGVLGGGQLGVELDVQRTLATNMAFLLQKIHADGDAAPKRDERPAFMNFIR